MFGKIVPAKKKKTNKTKTNNNNNKKQTILMNIGYVHPTIYQSLNILVLK